MRISILTVAGAAALAAAPLFAAGSSQPMTQSAQTATQGQTKTQTATQSMAKTATKPMGGGTKMAVTAGGMGMNHPDATRHFTAIAKGNLKAIMSQYAPDATLEWVGGKLNGSYEGTDAIQDMWARFAKGAGPLTMHATDFTVATAPKDGMTVTADVVFKGKAAIPVRYVLVYRNRKIVDEIWQVAPNLKAKM